MRGQLKSDRHLKQGFDRLTEKLDTFPDELTMEVYRKVPGADKFGEAATAFFISSLIIQDSRSVSSS